MKKTKEYALYKTCEYLTSKKGKKAILEAIKLAKNEIKEWEKFKRSAECLKTNNI